MDFGLSHEQQMVVDTVRDFVETVEEQEGAAPGEVGLEEVAAQALRGRAVDPVGPFLGGAGRVAQPLHHLEILVDGDQGRAELVRDEAQELALEHLAQVRETHQDQ